MTDLDASLAGNFTIAGDLPVSRLGFGAMRVTGPGVWGEPTDREAALRTLRRVPALGINFIDTADSYGPETSERLLRAALHPYTGLVIATKGGLTRPGPNRWVPDARPERLIAQAHISRDILGVEKIDLWQLHCIDPKVTRDEQLAAVRDLQRTGVIRHAGLSNVTVDDIIAAGKYFKVATVQNRYNLTDRSSDDVLNYCEAHQIGFIPWYPLASGGLAKDNGLLAQIAARLHATPGQIALAWLLRRSQVMLPIPGTSQITHLEENLRAASIKLSDEDFAALSTAA